MLRIENVAKFEKLAPSEKVLTLVLAITARQGQRAALRFSRRSTVVSSVVLGAQTSYRNSFHLLLLYGRRFTKSCSRTPSPQPARSRRRPQRVNVTRHFQRFHLLESSRSLTERKRSNSTFCFSADELANTFGLNCRAAWTRRRRRRNSSKSGTRRSKMRDRVRNDRGRNDYNRT